MSVDHIVASLARKRGLDPHAVLAVMRVESGGDPNSVGDNGSSFGLFQLHIGGALGHMSVAQAQKYRDAYRNADMATRMMASAGAAGLTGRAAVERIVTGFERPANAQAEIDKAMSYYGAGAPQTAATTPPGAAPVAGAGGMSPLAAMTLAKLLRASTKLTGAEAPTTLLGSLDQQAQTPALPTTPSPESPTSPGFSTGGGYPLAKRGKIIGTPYTGTHTLGNWESDNAVDISAKIGTPVVAMFDGTIGSQFGSLGSSGRFQGLRLHLDGSGNSAYYAHLSRYAPGIRPGTRVRKGQIIGYSGAANGIGHLHLAVQHGDPRRYLG